MSLYNKLEEIFIVYRLVHVLNIKKCNNDVYIQPANLSFNKHLLLVENSPIDKHRWKMELISCFSENKQTILILFDYNRVGTLNILMLSSHFSFPSSGWEEKICDTNRIWGRLPYNEGLPHLHFFISPIDFWGRLYY